MSRKDFAYFAGIVVVSVLLLANLLRPTAPHAYEMSEGKQNQSIAISGTGESAWAIIGDKIYYLSLRSRADMPSGLRSINIIDSRVLE